MSTSINRDEWMAAMKEAEKVTVPPSDALTTVEVMELFGIQRYAAKKRIDTMLRNGTAVRVQKRVLRTDGAVVTVAAYRLVKPEPKRSKGYRHA